jgi:hypothetical protein
MRRSRDARAGGEVEKDWEEKSGRGGRSRREVEAWREGRRRDAKGVRGFMMGRFSM